MIRTAPLMAAVLVLAGCSKPPLRPEMAARLIREAARFREPGFVGIARQAGSADCNSKLAEDANWRAAVKAGWLEVRNEDDFERATEGQPAVQCVGTLTGDGLRAGAVADTTTYQEWRVPAATRELVAVRSVSGSDDGIATVRFTYRWRLNAFGSQFFQPGPDLAGAVVLRLLDDGWHVADFTTLADFTPGGAANPG